MKPDRLFCGTSLFRRIPKAIADEKRYMQECADVVKMIASGDPNGVAAAKKVYETRPADA